MVEVTRCGIGNAIRNGTCADNPIVITRYLDSIESTAELIFCERERVALYLNTTQILLDTICDTLIPMHWRQMCLDQIYRPLLNAERLISHPEDRVKFARLQVEMHTLVPYFL